MCILFISSPLSSDWGAVLFYGIHTVPLLARYSAVIKCPTAAATNVKWAAAVNVYIV